MKLELKITCTCPKAKNSMCCQTPLVAPIAPSFRIRCVLIFIYFLFFIYYSVKTTDLIIWIEMTTTEEEIQSLLQLYKHEHRLREI